MNKYGVGTNKHVSGEKRKKLQTGFLYYQEKPRRFSVTFSTLICMHPGVLIGHIVNYVPPEGMVFERFRSEKRV